VPVERLTAEDALMLWPDEIWPQDIGGLAVLDGSGLLDPSGQVQTEMVRDAVAARLHLVPRFRQRLYVPPRRLGSPLWVDAASFDISNHIGVVPLPAPGDEAQLLLAVEQLQLRRLDRSRPLWEMWLLPGLPGQRVGWFVRMHHAMADGMASVAAVSAFLDLVPGTAAGPAQPWAPTAMPAPAALFADNLQQHARQAGRGMAALAHPAASARQVLAAWPAFRELLAGQPLPATSLNRLAGPGRKLALIRGQLGQVKAAAHSHSGTVNDVLLTVTAGGLRSLLRSRGEPVDGAVVGMYVPVSLHQGPRTAARGNQIGQMVIPLPVGVADPGRRLPRIAAETAQRKRRSQPSLGKLPWRGIGGKVVLKLISRQHVNVTSADLPGPEVPLYFAGARLLEVFPLVQLIGTVSLAVGAMSYAGQFNIMVVADQDAYPDLDVFVAGARDELRSLAAGRLSKLRDDLRGQPLGVLGLLEHRGEQDQLRARLGHLAQLGDAVGGRAGHSGRRYVRGQLPVQPRQAVVETAPRTPGVVVDGDVNALGQPELPGRPAGRRESLAHGQHLAGELGGGRGAGPEEAVTKPDRPPQRRGRAAAEPQRRVRLLERLRIQTRVP
jgi:WS/DGAT/MGAT family acyltransferase